MRVVAVFNPDSGTGHARRLALQYAEHLRIRGFRVDLCHSHGPPRSDALPFAAAELRHDDTVLVSGGDGTVHRLLPALLNAGAALCQLPAGTENLFGREFGTPDCPEAVELALRSNRRREVDLGSLAGIPFALMASIGPDAGIIRRLDACRTGPISHLSYLKPILREFLDPSIPLLSVTAQGKPWLNARRGMLVIANSRQYAWRLDPCRHANPNDGQLDAVFLPGDSAPDMARWAFDYLFTKPFALPPGILSHRATSFTIVNHAGPRSSPWQADGEVIPELPQNNGPFTTITLNSKKLNTLWCL